MFACVIVQSPPQRLPGTIAYDPRIGQPSEYKCWLYWHMVMKGKTVYRMRESRSVATGRRIYLGIWISETVRSIQRNAQ